MRVVNSFTACRVPNTTGYAVLIFLAFASISLLSGCSDKAQTVHLQGSTMGTTWHATVDPVPAQYDAASLQAELEQVFKTVNDQMSTWQEDSELSRFNQSPITDWIAVSPALLNVVSTALRLSEESAGVYDITVGPLVNLWGFGPHKELTDHVPDEAAIQAARARVGYQKIALQQQPPALRKLQADVYIDLSSIAKGYGVDQAAARLKALGAVNGMVEVGGEVFAWGESPRGDAWRIAIEKPLDLGRAVQQGIHLAGLGLATSGDYRNFFTDQGQRYSHTIDPMTGYPIKHSLASVSVLAANTMLADGYATLLMALGEQRGLAFAKQHQLAAYFIWRTDEGFATEATAAFQPYLMDLQSDPKPE